VISETTGTNHIDLEECKKRNITVMFSPHAATEAVSEHALELVSLALDNEVERRFLTTAVLFG